MSKHDLDLLLASTVTKLKGIDLADADLARRRIEAALPFESEPMHALRAQAMNGFEEGWLTPKQNGAIRFGRIAKDLDGFSIDAVWMDGPGPRHRHPNGEIDLAFALDGDPRFDGHPEGWVVFPPDSTHVPTVRGGSMLILYFLPGGAIAFE